MAALLRDAAHFHALCRRLLVEAPEAAQAWLVSSVLYSATSARREAHEPAQR